MIKLNVLIMRITTLRSFVYSNRIELPTVALRDVIYLGALINIYRQKETRFVKTTVW